MKQRLLSFVAIAAFGMGTALAQTWTAPVAPTSPAGQLLEKAAAPEADGNYFVMNVGEGQFLTGANVWATQISLSGDATPYMQVTLVAHESFENTFYMQRTNDANDKFYGDHGRDTGYNPPAGRNKLFRSGDDGYVDYNNNAGSSPLWMFNQATDGYYYIQSSTDDGVFPNAAEEYAGSTGAGKYVSFTKTIDDENITWAFIPVADVDMEAYAASSEEFKTQMAIYEARLVLLDILNDAAAYNVDYASASAIYNNASSTADELQAATEALKPAVAKAAVLASIATSSEESPVEITQYVLTNPSFDNGMTGWTITEGMGQNLQVQGNSYTNEDVDPAVTIQNFIEAWFPTTNGALKDGVICQTVTGLPEGRYRIEADLIAVWQGAALSEDPKGIYLFYDNGNFVLHSETLSTGNGKPEHFIFDFDYDGADEMTIGLMAQSTNMNWMGMDNLKLSAIGEVQTPPAFFALQSSVTNCEELYTENPKAQTSVTEAFRNAYAAANELASSNPEKDKAETYVQAYQTLDAARVAFVESVNAYIALQDLISRIDTDMERYAGDANFTQLISDLSTLKETYSANYDDGSYSTEDIQQNIQDYELVQPNYVRKIFEEAAAKVATGEALANPIDITVLFAPLTFPNTKTLAKDLEDKYGWNFTASENFNDNDGLKFEYHTAEGWSCIFDANTVVKGLPAGKYTVNVNAYYRPTTGEENLANYEAAGRPELAFFYVNNGNVNAEKAILNWDELLDFFPKTTTTDAETGEETEVENRPNNQQAAHNLFAAGDEACQKTELSVSAILRNNGDLTIGTKGIEGLAANSWVIWSDITLIYEGAIDAAALNEELLAYLDKADQIDLEASAANLLTAKAATQLNAARQNGETALQGDAATISAAIQQLSEAITYAEASVQLFEDLTDAYDEYDAKLQAVSAYGYNFKDTDYEGIIDEIYALLDSDVDNNEILQDYLDRLANGWYPYLFSCAELADASEDNPINMSLLLNNPNFDDMVDATKADPAGWTCTYESKDGGGREGIAEFWNASAFDIHQEVAELKDGYWRLSLDAVYRAGNAAEEATNEDGTYKNQTYLYINGIEKKIIQWGDTEKGAIIIPAVEEGEEPYTLKGNKYTINEVEIDAPNSQAQLLNFFAAERYHNSLIFAYGKDIEGALTGKVTIGLKKTEACSNDWCPFDNFKLEYLGTTKPEGEVEDGIAAANAEGARAIQSIFSIDGRQLSKLNRGINLVRTTDGKVIKVLVK